MVSLLRSYIEPDSSKFLCEKCNKQPIMIFGLLFFNWNDRRSRCVFFCFYSAIFKLMSVKFLTDAYNSKTVWSTHIKFLEQFEIIDLHVCTKF